MGNRRETIMRLAKGFFGRRKNCFSLAIRAVEKGLQKAYIGRKLKKRAARREWILQISAGAREHNISYAKLIFGMRYAEIGVNRKILATLAQQEPYSFRAIVEEAKLGLKKAVETDPRHAKTPRTKKYPPWLVSLAKEKDDFAADQWKLYRPRQKQAPTPSKDEIFAAAVAERAKERAAKAAARAQVEAEAEAAGGGAASVLVDGLLFPGDLKRAQPSFSASAAPIGAGGPADAGLAAALGGLSIGGDAAGGGGGGKGGEGGGGGEGRGGEGAVPAASEAPGATGEGGEAGPEAPGTAAQPGATEKGEPDPDAKG